MSQVKLAQLVEETRVTLDAEFARFLLEEVETYQNDRKLSKPTAEKMAADMAVGKFAAEQVSLAVCEFDGELYRINGQHTSHAVLICEEKEFPISLENVRFLKYQAETDDQLRELYARTDRGRARTGGDIVNSILGGLEGVGQGDKNVIKLLADGLTRWLYDNSKEQRWFSGEEAALAIRDDYRELATEVATFAVTLKAERGKHKHMFRAPVFAAMFASFDKDVDEAKKFWWSVASGLGFMTGDEPGYRLNMLLTNTALAGGRDKYIEKKAIPTELMYRCCVAAWNHYRDGNPLKEQLKPNKYKNSRPEAK